MKTISILQPWSDLIVSGVKSIENRTWLCHYRGPLAIHAGKGKKLYDVDAGAWEQSYGVRMPPMDKVTFGAIVGVAEMIGCVRVGDLEKEFPHLVGNPFAEGPWCFILDKARRIEPIPCLGQLSLWDTDLVK